MRFGPRPVAEAEGGVLVHAVREGALLLKKGVMIGPAERKALEDAGVREVSVALLDAGDVAENEAAHALARHLAGEGVRVDAPFTGRANIFAETAGVLRIDRAAIDAGNMVDEAVTIATLPDMRAVSEGEMVATVKIIPFAVPGKVLDGALAAAGGGVVQVAGFQRKRVGVVSTLLPGLKPSVVRKTLKTLEARLAPAGATIAADRECPHRAADLAAELALLAAGEADLFIVFGASAITDRRDVIPAAIEMAGGSVTHFGMPVDPGNLLLLGTLAGRPVLGAPGCARSPKENGFDWVLQRLLADVPVTRADIQRLGVGGLLMEIVSRPQPRLPAAPPPVAAVVLAAGRATRMGSNKLAETVDGKALVAHAVDAALASGARPVIVVTGHEPGMVRTALAGRKVGFVHNPDYASGLASSLKAGLAAVPAGAPGAVVLLGDMPRVSARVIDALAACFARSPEAAAVVPVMAGERGNPVLLGRSLFAATAALAGDTGARRLLAGPGVIELPLDDAGVLLDVDTPEALAVLRAGKAGSPG